MLELGVVYPVEHRTEVYMGDFYLCCVFEQHEYAFPPELFEGIDLWSHEFTEYAVWETIYKLTGSNKHEWGMIVNGKPHHTTVSHVISAITTMGRIGVKDYPAFHPEVYSTYELMFGRRFRRLGRPQ